MLYTRKGDSGTTQLYGGVARLSKADLILETLGTLDEFNAYLGLCKVLVEHAQERLFVQVGKKKVSVGDMLYGMQQSLFIIQAEIAGAKKKLTTSKVVHVEKLIDTIEVTMPPIHSFLLSGGTVLSAHLDVARTMARRAERHVVSLHEKEGYIHACTLAYMNRASSLLFALARYVNHCAQVTEESPTYK